MDSLRKHSSKLPSDSVMSKPFGELLLINSEQKSEPVGVASEYTLMCRETDEPAALSTN